MSYVFNPLTEEQLEAMNAVKIVEEGVYNFEVLKSTRKTSKSGNSMAELLIQIWDEQGKTHRIFDYLVFSNVNLNIKKVKHYCESVGIYEDYKKGELPEDMQGHTGKLELGVQDEMPKASGGFYPRKNIVIDYVKNDNALKSETKEKQFIDDEIPF